MTGTAEQRRLEILAAIDGIVDAAFSLEPGGAVDRAAPLPQEAIGRVLDLIVPEVVDLAIVVAPDSEAGGDHVFVRATGPRTREIEQRIGGPRVRIRGERQRNGEAHMNGSDELLRGLSREPADLALLRSLEFERWWAVPLRSRQRLLGSMTVGHSEQHAFDDADRRWLDLVASRLALALDVASVRARAGDAVGELDAILAGLADAVTVQDRGGRLVYANQAAAEMLGYQSPAELLAAGGLAAAKRFASYLEDGRELDYDDLPARRLLAGEADPPPVLIRAVPRGGAEERWTLTKATPLHGPDGDIRMAVNIMEDVTEQKHAQLREQLIARAGALFSSSLQYERILDDVARLVVTDVADWCAFELVRDDALESMAVAHADPERAALVRRERQRHPIDLEGSVREVLEDGRSVIYRELGDSTAGDADDVVAFLRALGSHSALVVPLRAAPESFGLLTVGWSERPFSDADIRLVEELGRRAGAAIANAQLFSERSHIAETLQRSLLPEQFPRLPGWQISSLYRAAGYANDVGGDFYDVFEARGDRYALIGDVVGKGAEAAALTSLARYAIRTAMSLTGDPPRAFSELNNQLRQRGPLALCTALLVRLGEDGVSIVSAGHPLPLLVRDGRAVEIGTHGALLGAQYHAEWEESTVRIGPGDALVLYTDGVLDTVGERERFGEARLRAALSVEARSARELVTVLDRALTDFQQGPQRDDTAVLALVRSEVAEPVVRQVGELVPG